MAKKPDTSGVVVVGSTTRPLQDLYNGMLRISWPAALLGIASAYLALNVAFAVGYWIIGGLAGSRGGFVDTFFFSVETMGTIGYGEMYPASTATHVLVVIESVVGLIVTALVTGIVFSKFSIRESGMLFAKHVAISPMNKVPTLQVRVGNSRASIISEAVVRVAMVRTEVTEEGTTFYRLVDLPLVRERTPALSRSWTVMHPINDKSPLNGATPESLDQDEVELIVTVVGTDDTSLQPVHARYRYETKDILWGARHADVLSARPDGLVELDVRKFNEIVTTQATDDFRYPR